MKQAKYMPALLALALCVSCAGPAAPPPSEEPSASAGATPPTQSSLPEEEPFVWGWGDEVTPLTGGLPAKPPSPLESGPLEGLAQKDIARLSCRSATLTAILRDGSLVLWGGNAFGGIGNGERDIDEDGNILTSPPYRHVFDGAVVDAQSGVSSYVLTDKGEVHTWGENRTFEAGHKYWPVLRPTRVEELEDIVQVSMSTAFSLALDRQGRVYHTGVRVEEFDSVSDYSQNYHTKNTTPTLLFTPFPLEIPCARLDSSAIAYVFHTPEGEIYLQGMLIGDALRQTPDIIFKTPTKIPFPEPIVQTVALSSNLVALSETGRVYVYGRPGTGLSNPGEDLLISELLYQKPLEDIVSISGGEYNAGALTREGEIYAWGMDSNGTIRASNDNLPFGEYEIISTPLKLELKNIVQFTLGTINGTAIDRDGKVYVWGSNKVGQFIQLE